MFMKNIGAIAIITYATVLLIAGMLSYSLADGDIGGEDGGNGLGAGLVTGAEAEDVNAAGIGVEAAGSEVENGTEDVYAYKDEDRDMLSAMFTLGEMLNPLFSKESKLSTKAPHI
ncbi:MAG: hypothetical protein LBL49_06650 [Clostridiales Family XIII bacterium]|jgi:hypothetical protein|nr:hypothetical protein [Clostridiales Family XIII bacterium]